ncbi:carbonic anhydrase [Oscillospiraceae bacterium WX1]
MTAAEAIEKLKAGNGRFVSGKQSDKELGAAKRRDLTENGQHPFAVIVCCSDSRVAPEILFDQGLGDIFIIRTAGNVVDDIGLGSIEYGAEHLNVPVIVVLGHEKCGAVKATVDGGEMHGCIKAIADKIKPSLEKVRTSSDVYGACEDENVRTTVAEIKRNPVIAELIEEDRVTVVGAKYAILSGVVTFFEN